MGAAVSADDLLLFRLVDDPERRGLAAGLLDEGVGLGWRREDPVEVWELCEAGFAPGEPPVAVAATTEPDRGQQARLVAATVAPAQRDRGIGTCVLEELADALRARGVLRLAAIVASHNGAAITILLRAGFTLSATERAAHMASGSCTMCFDLEL